MLDRGVYTLAEVKKYTGVPATTLRSWFVGRSDGAGRGPIFLSEFQPEKGDVAVSFLNLIEAHVASFFKGQGVKPANIRLAHTKLQQRLGIAHPFAHQELRTDGQRIYEIIAAEDASDAITRQMCLRLIVPHFQGIQYGTLNKLAETWRIHKGVVINPKLGFGKPVVENTGVSTLIIAKQYKANRMNAAAVANLFKITEEGVLNAFAFEKSLGRIAA